ncbi:MAG TPA: spore germination protein, partial [Bacillota bacterium]|nr:spore germination protein [Bacillota bacterium]
GTLSAVVIGQATVMAGYVSPSVIIVAAISAIASFAVSTAALVYSARMVNYFFILLAGIFGMFGLINGIVLVIWHLTCLQSFGVPFFYPFVPFSLEGMKDTPLRLPQSSLKKRLRMMAPFNRYRLGAKGEDTNERAN